MLSRVDEKLLGTMQVQLGEVGEPWGGLVSIMTEATKGYTAIRAAEVGVEQARAERVRQAWERYYKSLKKRAEEEKLKPKIEEKAPRKVKTVLPVVNPTDNPIIAARD